MMDRKFWVFLLLIFMVLSRVTSIEAASYAPESGGTLLLIGQDRNTILQYVKAIENTPAGVMLYTSVQDLSGLEAAADCGSGIQHGNALLKSYPNSVIQIGLYMVNALEGIISGQYDENLKKLAQWIKKSNRPIYLRIGYEFDLPQNHYDPDQYKIAFKYIVNRMRKERVGNVAYVWHSYSMEDKGNSWMNWYPGDEYVDWFGSSLFSTQQLQTVTHFLKLSREHQKPFMIAESTPNGLYTVRGKIDWFNRVFRFIEENNIEAFSYINSNWDVMPMWKGQSWGDARIEKNPEIREMWLKEIKQSRYIQASPKLFRLLGWKGKENL